MKVPDSDEDDEEDDEDEEDEDSDEELLEDLFSSTLTGGSGTCFGRDLKYSRRSSL